MKWGQTHRWGESRVTASGGGVGGAGLSTKEKGLTDVDNSVVIAGAGGIRALMVREKIQER